MPHMKPLNWIFILIMLTLSLISLMVAIYYSYKEDPNNKKVMEYKKMRNKWQ